MFSPPCDVFDEAEKNIVEERNIVPVRQTWLVVALVPEVVVPGVAGDAVAVVAVFVVLVLTQVLHSGYPANMQIRFSSPGPLE